MSSPSKTPLRASPPRELQELDTVTVLALPGAGAVDGTPAPLRDAALEESDTAPSFADLAQRALTDCKEPLLHAATWWCRDAPFPGGWLHQRIAEGGRVTVLVPREQAADETGEKLGQPVQSMRRAVVAGLGAAGFAVTRDVVDPRDARLQRIEALRTELRCRYFRPGDERRILDLFVASFGPHRTLEHWRWKFEENPYRSHLISLVETAAGDLVTHYGGFGVPVLRVRDGATESLLAMQMGDTMTHPAFRHVGRRQTALLPRAVRHFFARYRTAEFSFYFGFNRGPIQRFCRWFIGGDRIEPVGYWQRETSAVNQPSGQFAGAVGDLRVTEEAPKGEFDDFLARVAPTYGLLVRKDERYLQWRYRDCPDHRYVLLTARGGKEGEGIAGWAVFRREGDVLLWGDLLLDRKQPGAASALLLAALRHPELQGTQRIEGWFSSSPAWSCELIRSLGFERSPHPQGLALVALANPPQFALSELEGFYTTWGDSDLY